MTTHTDQSKQEKGEGRSRQDPNSDRSNEDPPFSFLLFVSRHECSVTVNVADYRNRWVITYSPYGHSGHGGRRRIVVVRVADGAAAAVRVPVAAERRLGRRHRSRQVGRSGPRPDGVRLRSPRRRTAAGNHELQFRGNHRQEAVKAVESADLLAGVEEKLAEDSKRAPSVTPAARSAVEAPTPMTSDMLAGRRLITLLFDVSSMQPEDVQRAVDSANEVRRRADDRRPISSRSRRWDRP